MRGSWSQYAGAVIGLQGWVIGLVVVALASGSTGVLATVVPACSAMSFGLAFALVAGLEAVRRTAPEDRGLHALFLWGHLLVDMGVLLLVADAWAMPALLAEPDAERVLRSLGAMTDIPSWLPLVLFAAGAAVGLAAARRVLRGAVPA